MDTALDSKPRRNMQVGLICFGSLCILLGLICLLMVPVMFLGRFIPVKGQEPLALSMCVAAGLFYLFIAVLDIWLGIGSILCQRWARRVILLWSLFWLLSGVIALVAYALMSGQMDAALAQSQAKMPPGFATGFKVAMFFFMSFIYVVLPGAFTWFYSLRDTRLTCEARHPGISWTEQCPMPVLGLALMAGMWALCLPLMLLYAPVFPFFGIYLEGASAILIILVLSALVAWSGWGIYRLNPNGWWLNLLLFLFMVASYIATFTQGGIIELYHRMQMPAQTMKLLEASPILKSPWLGFSGLLFALPYLGWMLYVRKYFGVKKAIPFPLL